MDPSTVYRPSPPDAVMDRHQLPTIASEDKDQHVKKARHRHTPVQLTALNALFDKAEHPSLDERTSLAARLGMETKTVNAWFQNKRASTKKKNKGPVSESYDLPPIASLLASRGTSASYSPLQVDELDDFDDDDYLEHGGMGPSPLVAALDDPRRQALFYAGNPDQKHVFAEAEQMPRRMRMRNRPTAEQTEELRRMFASNPHPSKEDREELGERISMSLKSITNWFQNQRSQAKKRKEDEHLAEIDPISIRSTLPEPMQEKLFSALPPAANHPSLLPSLPPHTSHPSLSIPPRIHELPNLSISSRSIPRPDTISLSSPRRSTPRRSSTPYSLSASTSLARPRRTRPEPFQLEELKKLNMKTSNPSIEERSALALEIGMDVGKVTNWFRNLRQTARKRANRSGGHLDEDGDHDDELLPESRAGSPSLRSSSSSTDHMDVDDNSPSDAGSEEDFQEAVTPSPDGSPAPAPPKLSGQGHHRPNRTRDVMDMVVDYSPIPKMPNSHCTGVKVEDALLLLSFHKHVVPT